MNTVSNPTLTRGAATNKPYASFSGHSPGNGTPGRHLVGANKTNGRFAGLAAPCLGGPALPNPSAACARALKGILSFSKGEKDRVRTPRPNPRIASLSSVETRSTTPLKGWKYRDAVERRGKIRIARERHTIAAGLFIKEHLFGRGGLGNQNQWRAVPDP
jgi:hypothetical protein